MNSWLRRKTSSSGGSSPLLGKDKKKEDKELANLTPLERLLYDAGKNEQPVRDDGNDKFFGLENFGNTCYANSILQSLYFSEPFREEVINYPQRAPIDTVINGPDGLPRPTVKITPQATVPQNKQKNPASPATARTATKPEDKNSAEYKKKQALIKGPVVPMDYDNSNNYGMSESLFTSLKDYFEGVIANKARMGVIRPTKLVETMKKEKSEFNTAQHQDAHEFLNLLLNSVIDTVEADARHKKDALAASTSNANEALVHAHVKALNENGAAVGPVTSAQPSSQWVHDLFRGTLTSETVCLTCEKTSQRDEPFIDLSVDIEQHSSVTSCLRQFSEDEMLSERNKFSCDNCGYTESQKRMKIKQLPRILALHLKRFKAVDMDGWRLQKLFHRVVYPFHLRLFNTTEDAEDPDKLYELYAVVVHIGAGPFQGHYVSVVKTKESGWVLFDDELVEPVKKEFVQNFFGDRPGQATAYVLFYQETTEEKFKAEEAREAAAAMPKLAMQARPAMPAAVKSPAISVGLGLASPATNGIKTTPVLSTPAEDDEFAKDPLAHAKTASPSLLPVNGAFPLDPNMAGLEHAHTQIPSSQPMNGLQPPASAPPTKTSFLNRMRRSSKSSKNFFGSLDLTKETRRISAMPDMNGTYGGIPDTTGEVTPRLTANGTAGPLENPLGLPDTNHTPPPPPSSSSGTGSETQLAPVPASAPTSVPDPAPAPATHEQDADSIANGSTAPPKRRFLSLRRKPGDKSEKNKSGEKTLSLRKTASRGNILGFRKDEKTES